MIGSAMGMSNKKICGQIILYGEYGVVISMRGPQHYTGMQHLNPKRMIPAAASAFIYYDIVTCFDRSRVLERRGSERHNRYSGANDQFTSKAQGAGSR
jgi:hypothetical protein